jgi:O-6-methylguanine DNA methyltransferase
MNKQILLPKLDYRCFASPLGWLLLAATEEGICLIHFCGSENPSRESCLALLHAAYSRVPATLAQGYPVLPEAEEAILGYLHHRRPLPTLPLDVRAGTPFQRQVWDVLCRIPFGETRSYLEVARSVGRPRAPRAVGQACGRNPLPLLIPCHRVVAAKGRLGGYSGGLHIKQALLAIEQNQGFTEAKPEE